MIVTAIARLPRPTLASLEQALQVSPPPRFSPSRWPFTYACDLLRSHPEIVPQEVHDRIFELLSTRSNPSNDITTPLRMAIESRADASHVRNVWAALAGDMAHAELSELLAEVYCQLEGIIIPAEILREVRRRG